ncbi:DeoR/GlpR family DNA-binding transcription regulator [Conexibacter stalactiti]|uniref:DeoR/GlpR family DNA-binding transcription regulator n=1 Tax=Conexibacter stalactiti TaxID=1940611 RepID=A0ABU4HIF7_9ACTN|nr:DeoR/GlpR family DNA-binding transcription regulator [Conexibacter stalactiti]MDW5593052.1 DeoR/GlpR family DNA-binding transcription regulator [Conexibacter stalactiti]MEC5033693.1 DeoR/GlpR family DNA-binding transcription regulator [Conexibacter stalactiti]
MSSLRPTTSTSSRDRRPAGLRIIKIERMLRESGTLTVADVTARFAVSSVTVRRDFDELARRRLATRTHGGIVLRALPPRRGSRRPTGANVASRRLAAAAVSLLEPNETAFVDGSAAALAVAHEIVNRRVQINVVTTSLAIAALLMDRGRDDTTIVLAGGAFRPVTQTFVGRVAVDALKRHFVDRAVIGCDAVNPFGLLERDPKVAAVKGAMLEHSREALVLIDSTTTVAEAGHRLPVAPTSAVALVADDVSDACRATVLELGIQTRAG